jgi:hypothetical protein
MYVLPFAVCACELLGTFVFQAMELRHLRVAAPHRRIMFTQPHGQQTPARRIRPTVPFRAQPSSHNRRNVNVPTGKIFMFSTEITKVEFYSNLDFTGVITEIGWSRAAPSCLFYVSGHRPDASFKDAEAKHEVLVQFPTSEVETPASLIPCCMH